MRCTYHLLLATVIIVAPLPVAAQVSIDLNALNGLGAANLPTPPPSAPLSVHRSYHRRHRLVRAEPGGQSAGTPVVASAAPAGPDGIEHPANLGSSFSSLPSLPGAAPPAPPPPPVLTSAAAPQPAKKAATAPPLALPVAVPPPPSTSAAAASAAPASPAPPSPAPASPAPASPAPASLAPAPARLAEATPPPPAAQPQRPKAAPDALPKGADRLTLPFFVDESALPLAETAMLRDFAGRYGGAAQYTIRAFATSPAGDDDPSTPRRIALARAQSVAAALMDSGVQPDRLRLLALGSAGGAPADRVEVIAMPPSSGHTNVVSSP